MIVTIPSQEAAIIASKQQTIQIAKLLADKAAAELRAAELDYLTSFMELGLKYGFNPKNDPHKFDQDGSLLIEIPDKEPVLEIATKKKAKGE